MRMQQDLKALSLVNMDQIVFVSFILVVPTAASISRSICKDAMSVNLWHVRCDDCHKKFCSEHLNNDGLCTECGYALQDFQLKHGIEPSDEFYY